LLKLDDAVGRLERLEEKSVVADDNNDDTENELPLNDMEQLTCFEEQLKNATFFTKMVIRYIILSSYNKSVSYMFSLTENRLHALF